MAGQWSAPSAADVKKKWSQIVDDLLDVRRNFWLNSAFFRGEQHVSWDSERASASILNFADLEDEQSRTTVNKIKPRCISLQARLSRTPLAFEPRANGSDADAIRVARMERQVLEVEAHRGRWEHKRRTNILFTLLGGVSGIAVEPDWDYSGGGVVTDQASGLPIQLPKRPSVKVTALSGVEFGLEPGTREDCDANWWIRCTTLTPDQAQATYGLGRAPKPDADSTGSPMHRELLTTRKRGSTTNNAVLVYVYYERPHASSPGGVVHVIGDQVVREHPWPFSFNELNITTFRQTDVGTTWKGDTILNDARQLQVSYNKLYSSINAHIGKADNARMLVPEGSVVDSDFELTGQAAEVIVFDKEKGEPHWMLAPQIPRWAREHRGDLQMEMDDLFSTHEVSRGQAPGDRNSGLALSILAEKDETPLGLMAADQQHGWQRVAEQVLSTNKALLMQVDRQVAAATGEKDYRHRVSDVMMVNEREPVDVIWSAADLSDNPVVHVPLETVMPRSKAAIQDTLLRLAQTFPQMFGAFSPADLAKMLEVPDPTLFLETADYHVGRATRENERMIAGADDREVEVYDWDNHDVHVQEHNRLRASERYRNAPDQVKFYIDDHVDAHVVLAAEQRQKAMEMQQQAALAAAPPEQTENEERAA